VPEKQATDWSEKLDKSLYESIIRAHLMVHYNALRNLKFSGTLRTIEFCYNRIYSSYTPALSPFFSFHLFRNCSACSYLCVRSGGYELRGNYIDTTSSVLFRRILMEEDGVIDTSPVFLLWTHPIKMF